MFAGISEMAPQINISTFNSASISAKREGNSG
jgi:hypothetical protein